ATKANVSGRTWLYRSDWCGGNLMMRTLVIALAMAAVWPQQALAETIDLRCRQEVSEVYSMGRTAMMSMTYTEPTDVVILLDTETDRATLDQNAGMFDVGDQQVLIMMVSDQLKEVRDID